LVIFLRSVMYRDHTCGQLNAQDCGKEVSLSGWVSSRRDHGGVIFIDLRDRYGITQIVFDPSAPQEVINVGEMCRSEYVIQITGTVRNRPEGQTNDKIPTGEIEVLIKTATILAAAKTPPFEISDYCDASEDIRMKYRYLDLRRKKVLDNVMFRSSMNHFVRNWFTQKGFLEIQTPIFTVSSPEGARDYLVPSRLHHGKFYALPQAPQIYKQLLMVGGIDKYFQIAPCFRDEDPRADRHSCEFYQIDCEMSFVHQEDIFSVVESFAPELIATLTPHKTLTKNSFTRLRHSDALELYGSDKPDLRFDMHFEDFTEEFKTSGFSVFQAVAQSGGVVKAMKAENIAMSRKEIDDLTAFAQGQGAKGLAYIIYDAEGPRSPILKYFTGNELEAIAKKLSPKTGDMIFFGAGEKKPTQKILGSVRNKIRDMFHLVSKDDICFVWITDFPMFEQDAATGKIDFEHNPFSMPHGGAAAFDNPNPLEIYGEQYDLACNGYEVLSGSVRNHDLASLVKGFAIVGKGEEEVKAKFGAMYGAFQFGVPPHGGFAFGFDRLLMILKDEDNIREIYAFPKSGRAEDAMMSAPSYIDDEQMKEL